MRSRLRSLSLSVAVLALFGSAAAIACADDVKGPVHITSRGVEFPGRYEPDRPSDRDAGRGASEADRLARDAARARAGVAREVAEAVRDAAREVAHERSRIVRETADAVREAAREVQRERGRIAREVAEAAREVARNNRELAEAARHAARDALHGQDVRIVVEKAMLVARDAIGTARDGITEAQRDLDRQSERLNDMIAGDFSNVVVIRDGKRKCGDVSKHAGCEPLSEADKQEIRATTEAALEQARAGIEAARAGLQAAAEAMQGAETP